MLVDMITHWQDNVIQTEGYILRSFKRDLSFRESLDHAALNKILKLLQRKAKMHNIGELLGHSFRVGAELDFLDRGVQFESMMIRSG